jgi:hypothetical protein
MPFRIGTAVAFKTESFGKTPDDRQSMIKVVGGVAVQDNGRVEDGDVINARLKFNAANWAIVEGYWNNRTKVTVIDLAGRTYENCRILVKNIEWAIEFPDKYDITLEIWRV